MPSNNSTVETDSYEEIGTPSEFKEWASKLKQNDQAGGKRRKRSSKSKGKKRSSKRSRSRSRSKKAKSSSRKGSRKRHSKKSKEMSGGKRRRSKSKSVGKKKSRSRSKSVKKATGGKRKSRGMKRGVNPFFELKSYIGKKLGNEGPAASLVVSKYVEKTGVTGPEKYEEAKKLFNADSEANHKKYLEAAVKEMASKRAASKGKPRKPRKSKKSKEAEVTETE
jgi:hypothetical protein